MLANEPFPPLIRCRRKYRRKVASSKQSANLGPATFATRQGRVGVARRVLDRLWVATALGCVAVVANKGAGQKLASVEAASPETVAMQAELCGYGSLPLASTVLRPDRCCRLHAARNLGDGCQGCASPRKVDSRIMLLVDVELNQFQDVSEQPGNDLVLEDRATHHASHGRYVTPIVSATRQLLTWCVVETTV